MQIKAVSIYMYIIPPLVSISHKPKQNQTSSFGFSSFTITTTSTTISIMSSSTKLSLIIFFTSTLFFNGILGQILLVCEDLPVSVCAFAVASSGKRCLLENFENKNGQLDYQCRSSEVVVPMLAEHVETDSCIAACGVDRKSVGISSDSLLEPQFTAKLCSPDCYTGCPNVVDLYFNLAAGEGLFLPELCAKQITNPHRAMVELLSSSVAVEHLAASSISIRFHKISIIP